jgi:hypothetical protein
MARPERPPFIASGQRFTRWLVLAPCRTEKGRLLWTCRCDCGVLRNLPKHQLVGRVSRSCGCLQKETVRQLRRSAATHGHARAGGRSAEYLCWRAMINRCENENVEHFEHYGGRGITVCPEWRSSFPTFLADVGIRPGAKFSLGRIDNDGNYEPTNVRWETTSQQARNRRSTRLLTAHGITLPLVDWAARTGLGRTAISQRLRHGWSEEDAVTKPLRGNL